MNARASSVNDPIIVDQKLMVALRTYLNIAVDDVSCMIAKFFHMFLFESPLLESYEVDNFILRNGDMLHTWCVPCPHKIDLCSLTSAQCLGAIRGPARRNIEHQD